MPAKIIVSYDGTANEDDAVALGRVFGQAGAEVSLAYVAHTEDSVGDTQGILSRGLSLLGDANAAGAAKIFRRIFRPSILAVRSVSVAR